MPLTATPSSVHEAAVTAAPGAFVTFDRVNKSYGAKSLVLDQVSFRAAEGDFISLIGPSGCGKSTILKVLAGLVKATSGQTLVQNLPPEKARRLTSFVFQDPTLLPWRTTERNIALTLELEKMPASQRAARVSQLLKLVGLEKAADLYPRQLSGGMKMRVSIARALASSPKLLLMDEPFGALDEMTRNRLNEEILRIRNEQKWTAFFVTHSVAEAVFLSTRIFVMQANPGKVVREIPIDLPTPRIAHLREDPRYLAALAEVTAALHGVES